MYLLFYLIEGVLVFLKLIFFACLSHELFSINLEFRVTVPEEYWQEKAISKIELYQYCIKNVNTYLCSFLINRL